VGDKVEWIPSDEVPGEFWPLLLRRNDEEILRMYNEFGTRSGGTGIRSGSRSSSTATNSRRVRRRSSTKRVKRQRESKRSTGAKNLGWDDFEWGLLSGRMSALAWVLGMDWDESLDT
jgi:hypothetical protein